MVCQVENADERSKYMALRVEYARSIPETIAGVPVVSLYVYLSVVYNEYLGLCTVAEAAGASFVQVSRASSP